MISKRIAAGFIALGFLGFLDSSYLAAKYYLGTPINCSIFEGCNQVASSPYAVMFGLPVALYGVAYYLAIFIATIAALDAGSAKIFRLVSWATVLGLLASAYFTYLQAFVISAWCIYCLGSAAISTILFVLGIMARRKLVAPTVVQRAEDHG